MNAPLTAWELAEIDADLHREHDRAQRLKQRRETRFWPPIAVALILGGYVLAGLIENGYIQ